MKPKSPLPLAVGAITSVILLSFLFGPISIDISRLWREGVCAETAKKYLILIHVLSIIKNMQTESNLINF